MVVQDIALNPQEDKPFLESLLTKRLHNLNLNSELELLSNESLNHGTIRTVIDKIKNDLINKQYTNSDLKKFIKYNKDTIKAGLLTTVLAENFLDSKINQPISREEAEQDFLKIENYNKGIDEYNKTHTKNKKRKKRHAKSPLRAQAEIFNLAEDQKFGFLGFSKDYLSNVDQTQAAFAQEILIHNSNGRSAYKAKKCTLEGIAKDTSFEKAIETIGKDIVAKDTSFKGAIGTEAENIYAYNTSFKGAIGTIVKNEIIAFGVTFEGSIETTAKTINANKYAFKNSIRTIAEDIYANGFSFEGSEGTTAKKEIVASGQSFRLTTRTIAEDIHANDYSFEGSIETTAKNNIRSYGNSFRNVIGTTAKNNIYGETNSFEDSIGTTAKNNILAFSNSFKGANVTRAKNEIIAIHNSFEESAHTNANKICVNDYAFKKSTSINGLTSDGILHLLKNKIYYLFSNN